MEKFTELVKENLKDRRNLKRKIFRLAGTIYRGISNNRFTLEQAEEKLFGGMANE